MLNIRAEQRDAMGRPGEDAFVEELATHLLEDLPDRLAFHQIAPEAVEAEVRAGIDRAREWGLEFKEDLTLFIECMMALGLHFDEDPSQPWAREILSDPKLSGSEKMDRIDEHLFFGQGTPQ